ncbi:MAG: carbohydrate binding domain-containing protein, partial [Pseudomonadota bacterium]
YECHVDRIKGTYISRDLQCEGHTNFGPVGYIYNDSANGRVPLFTVSLGNGSNYLLSDQADEANGRGTLLGYVDSTAVAPQALPARDASFLDTDQPGAAQTANAPTTPTANVATETKTDSWGDCSAGSESPCGYLQFSHMPGQTHKLNCRTDYLADARITLNFGNTEYGTVENLHVDSVVNNPTQNISLNIPDNATWASLTLETDSANLAACTMFSEGGLPTSAAFDQERYGLLYNGGFEASITDWEFCSEEGTADNAFEGSRAASIDSGNCVFQEVEIEPEQQYTMSCHALNISGDTTLSLTLANSGYQTLVTQSETVEGNSYQAYTATLTAPATSSFAVVTMSTSGSALLDNCSLKLVTQ